MVPPNQEQVLLRPSKNEVPPSRNFEVLSSQKLDWASFPTSTVLIQIETSCFPTKKILPTADQLSTPTSVLANTVDSEVQIGDTQLSYCCTGSPFFSGLPTKCPRSRPPSRHPSGSSRKLNMHSKINNSLPGF